MIIDVSLRVAVGYSLLACLWGARAADRLFVAAFTQSEAKLRAEPEDVNFAFAESYWKRSPCLFCKSSLATRAGKGPCISPWIPTSNE